jgi:hypothetical protein
MSAGIRNRVEDHPDHPLGVVVDELAFGPVEDAGRNDDRYTSQASGPYGDAVGDWGSGSGVVARVIGIVDVGVHARRDPEFEGRTARLRIAGAAPLQGHLIQREDRDETGIGVGVVVGDPSRPGAMEIDLLVRRTIEAGLITVYCRPFIGSKGLPKLSPSSSMAEHLKAFHRVVLNQRHTVQAHTDETDFRVVLDFDKPDWLETFFATGGKGFAETWSPPTAAQLTYFVDLATANRESFVAAIERLHDRLTRTDDEARSEDG